MSGMDYVEFYMNDMVQDTIFGPGPEYKWSVRYYPLAHVIFWSMGYDKAGNKNADEIHGHFNNLQSSNVNKNINDIKFKNYNSKIILQSKTINKKNHENVNKIPLIDFKEEVFDPAYVLIEFNRDYRKNDWIVDDVTIPLPASLGTGLYLGTFEAAAASRQVSRQSFDLIQYFVAFQ